MSEEDNRVGNRCSRCGTLTSGPHSEPDKALNVGVAAHITAAAPGGPRYDSTLTKQQRASPHNGVWLCQTCGKLVDNDPTRFTVTEMRAWKQKAEDEASKQIGRTRPERQPSSAARERQVKHDLALKKRMVKDFEVGYTEVIIRSMEDTTYPDPADAPGISSWFNVEIWAFYHGGLEVVLQLQSGVIDDEGYWATLEYRQEFDEERFQKIKLINVGRIPWRNIVNYDLDGDEYFSRPHIYCKFAADGTGPYETSYYAEFDEPGWPLDKARRIKLGSPETPV
jgi:hypothetical protein